MKKVRFESPVKKGFRFINMEERECHSPRPFTERQVLTNAPDIYNYPKVLPYSNDPVQMFECSNSSPYPTMNKTNISYHDKGPEWSPCNDLELSLLDATNFEPRKPTFSRSILKASVVENNNIDNTKEARISIQNQPALITENKPGKSPPNILIKDDDFFIKRDNLGKIHFNMQPIQQQLDRLSLDKENNPFMMKSQAMQMTGVSQKDMQPVPLPVTADVINDYNGRDCQCHHCVKRIPSHMLNRNANQLMYQNPGTCNPYVGNNARLNHCMCGLPPPPSRCCNHIPHIQQDIHQAPDTVQFCGEKMNAVDKKTWAIEKYEQSKKSGTMEVEKQTNITKEKREPTVSDLFKIIKLQNEQLQLLQEKVDKFISASQQQNTPAQNHISEHVTIETVDNEQHKISIGVMTSFEMVRTSTIINKEVANENAQIQCNRSQISIKEVRSKSQSPNMNFLDGITPMGVSLPEQQDQEKFLGNVTSQPVNEEKTLNELSLYNVQVDNATTPLMSPEQTMYLDVRDYSE